jgi:hypothetical protein
MLDETMILETPPLYHGYGRRGQQVEVPVTGSHAKRVLHGAINVRRGVIALFPTMCSVRQWESTSHNVSLASGQHKWGWQEGTYLVK